MTIIIGELTDLQKLEVADLENKLRALNKLHEDMMIDLQAYSAQTFKKTSDIEQEKNKIIKLLESTREITYETIK